MKKAELLKILEEYKFHPGRFLGQNFLLDQNLLAWIVRTVDPQPGELILEAGPGFGALTRGMLDAGAEVHAIEFDRRICDYLNKNMHDPNFHLVEGDACRVDLDEITGGRDFRAAANLPGRRAVQLCALDAYGGGAAAAARWATGAGAEGG